MEKKISAPVKIISVILGTLVGGFMWRCRGESGFGSSWGLYSVALVLLLLIWQIYGRKKGMKFEYIPIGALLAGLGVTGYATVIEQLSGTVWSDLPFAGGDPVYMPVDPKSGMAIILIMGFTLIPLFSFFTGTLFSEKEYKIKHFVIAIVLFFGVGYIMKATLAHPIMKLINPEQVNYAALGLADAGYDYSSPFAAYMAHFGGRRWTQEIPFFENYYMSIEHISDFFGVIALLLYALIGMKDKITFAFALVTNTFVSVATTALSLLIAAPFESGFLEGVPCLDVLKTGSGWGIWEFSTGAAVGFIITLIAALLPAKYTAQTKPDRAPLIDGKIPAFVFDLAACVFVFGVVPARVIGIRFNKLIKYMGLTEDGDTLGTVIIIVLSVIFGLYMIKTLKRNVLDGMGMPFYYDPHRLSFIIFPAYLLMCAFAYFFLNHGYVQNLPYSEMTGLSQAFGIMTGAENIVTALMLLTFALICIIYFPLRKKLKE